MNRKLKARMILVYGGQWKFSAAIDEHETVVSKVVRERRELSAEKKRVWAKALKCKPEDIFDQ